MGRLLRASVAGALLGAGWGAVARGFMRLLTTQPEFSWEGTLFIVGIFVVAGALVGLVHGARTGGRSPWWRLAGLPALLVFFGQGLVLLPGAVGFACVALNYAALPALRLDEASRQYVYLLRLVGFLFIVGAIVDKNRRR